MRGFRIAYAMLRVGRFSLSSSPSSPIGKLWKIAHRSDPTLNFFKLKFKLESDSFPEKLSHETDKISDKVQKAEMNIESSRF